MSAPIFNATSLGGGDKAITLTEFLKLYVEDSKGQKTLISGYDGKITIPGTEIFLYDNSTYTAQSINTILVDTKISTTKITIEVDSDSYILITQEEYDESGKYSKINTGEIVYLYNVADEILNEMLFDTTSLRGGTRAVSITHPKLLNYLSLQGNNKTLEIGKDEKINTLVIDGSPAINLNCDIKIKYHGYVVVDTTDNINLILRKIDSINFSDVCYLVYNKNSTFIDVKETEKVNLIINDQINVTTEKECTLYGIFNYGLFNQYSNFVLEQSARNYKTGIWRCHGNLTALTFGNRGEALFYHDISEVKKGNHERGKLKFKGIFANGLSAKFRFDGDYDIILQNGGNRGGFFESTGGYFHFGNDIRIFIEKSNIDNPIVSNYGTMYFNCELNTDVPIIFINYDEGVLYLEKDFKTKDIDKINIKNDSIIINVSDKVKTTDINKKIDFSVENKHGMVLDVVNSLYYTKDNKSGVDIYKKFSNYSECVKYLYSSFVSAKDMQMLSLLNDYNTLRAVKNNDLSKIKILLVLICRALRIPV